MFFIQPHAHRGTDAPRINANDIEGPSLITATFQISARNTQSSILQRGSYTLAAGVKFVTFPQAYSTTTDLEVLLTTKTTNGQFLDSLATSGFTVSGSGTDTGNYLAVGYK